MANTNYDTDKVLLEACKHYIRITDINTEKFVIELCELASQYCDNLKNEIYDNGAKKVIHQGET